MTTSPPLSSFHVSEDSSPADFPALLALLEQRIIPGSTTIPEPSVQTLVEITKQLHNELRIMEGKVKIMKEREEKDREEWGRRMVEGEREDERRSNGLIKKIEDLNKQKGDFMMEAEREEEYMTNTLTRKLMQAQQDKVNLSRDLEVEQEFLVNRLTKDPSPAVDGGTEVPQTDVLVAKILAYQQEARINEQRHLAEIRSLQDELHSLKFHIARTPPLNRYSPITSPAGHDT